MPLIASASATGGASGDATCGEATLVDVCDAAPDPDDKFRLGTAGFLNIGGSFLPFAVPDAAGGPSGAR